MHSIKIGEKSVGHDYPCFIIAEIGLNHQGDIKLAKKLIDHAVAAGADCVKFQKRSLKDVYKSDVLVSVEKEEHGSNYILNHIKNTELTEHQMRELYRYALAKGVDFLCTPWDEKSLKFLATLNLPAYKIGSPDMFNFPLIRSVAKLKKPLIISTGMSFMSEVEQLIEFLKELKAAFVLLHCNSTYPAPYHDINLNFIKTLQNKYDNIVVGYSGHEPGISACLAAVALGAKVIEKHITIDRNLPGPDHKASLEPHEFIDLVREVRLVEMAMGDGSRYLTRGEYLNRQFLSKSIVAARNLPRGTVIKFADLDVRSPGKGTSPQKIGLFVGKRILNRNIKKHDYILDSDVDFAQAALHGEDYRRPDLNHPWGMVARMSDIDTMLYARPDFVEIHLTDSDIKGNEEYKKTYDVNLVVHGPEYDGDLLLNLSSLDHGIRRSSVQFFNKTLVHARKLKKLFKNRNEKAKFVIHPGGMNVERPRLEDIPQLNKNLLDSLKGLKADGFELIVENMPTCAWYFGGQWYHSSFMDADEIVAFSKRTGYGILFDVSHTALYCNYYHKNLSEYTKKILPVTRYIHISDAARLNGEGLGIGHGTIDFKKIMPELVKTKLWFLPEVWQGHKFGGAGYLLALKLLKNIKDHF